MDAELVGAPGLGPQRQESGVRTHAIQHAILCHRFLAHLAIDLHHLAVARARPLGERQSIAPSDLDGTPTTIAQ